MEDDGRLVLTVAEAAKALGISRALAYELVARGELPVLCLGRRRVIPRRALEALVNGATAVTMQQRCSGPRRRATHPRPNPMSPRLGGRRCPLSHLPQRHPSLNLFGTHQSLDIPVNSLVTVAVPFAISTLDNRLLSNSTHWHPAVPPRLPPC